MIQDLNTALFNYISDPKNALYNFSLAQVYEYMGHTAAAASFYIRTSEFSYDDLLTYEAILRLGLCFERQGSRVFTTKGLWLRAASLLPKRPEAYFLLSRIYEHCKDWQESYTFAVIGESLIEEPMQPLKTDVEYPGKYAFTFERAVTAWWIGLLDESLFLFRQLEKNLNVDSIHRRSIINNIINLGNSNWKNPIIYNNSLYEHLKVKFDGASNIEENYSQCYQDMFVLTMLNGKRGGTYLEIGCADPFYGNNTALLEKQFNWFNGISIDFDQSQIDKYPGVRNTQTICADATKIDYKELLSSFPKDIDYLQLDCDPPRVTFEVLMKIPFELYRFAVITFEHDHYSDDNSGVRDKSRKYLESQGYELVVANIAPDKYNTYEDWWVHPKLVDREIIYKIKDTSDKTKKADDFMLGRI
jgi:hypothetical protein